MKKVLWEQCRRTEIEAAAKADAVSPPATEKARGKLLAPNTPAGPNGILILRISGLGDGALSFWALSILASTHDPSRKRAANNFN